LVGGAAAAVGSRAASNNVAAEKAVTNLRFMSLPSGTRPDSSYATDQTERATPTPDRRRSKWS
jgi:hypothetical protein